uniref:Acyl-CoA dehydrogenase n=1 Tax=Thermosporothrix sp. COM3 TaxID=2490863 RepID=A0A455SSE1_9CHLR|nr:acyl-CoA dehydrogenase [Thermosporothrix sp. COM3]
MDFSWTPEQGRLYKDILHRVRENISLEQADRFWTRTQWELCGAFGLLGLSVPQHYGGRGYDCLTTALAIEAFGRACPDMGLVFSAAAHLFACCMPLAEHGNEEQKKRWLPGLCSGELIGANAISEPEAGSDVFAMKSRAIRDGASYVLQGVKSYVSNAPVADIFVIYASTEPAHGYLGITAFVVERGTPGLEVSEPFAKMGLTTTPAGQVTLHNCRIPDTNRIGAEGQGAQVFRHSMLWERACLFAAYLGQMDRQLEQTLEFVRSRHQFGQALSKKQAVTHRLADMKLRLEAARLLLYRACWQQALGEDATLAISLSKLAVSEAAIQASLDTLHLHGSKGFNCEAGLERMLRDAIPSTLFSGTSEIQRDIIARELGL